MEILKDASATAIYGSRGANGVVMITTKKGKSGKAKVSYDFEYGFQKANQETGFDGCPRKWARFYNEYLVNAEILETAPFSEADITAMGKGMDWQKSSFKMLPL